MSHFVLNSLNYYGKATCAHISHHYYPRIYLHQVPNIEMMRKKTLKLHIKYNLQYYKGRVPYISKESSYKRGSPFDFAGSEDQ